MSETNTEKSSFFRSFYKRNILRLSRLSDSRWRKVYLANILNWGALKILYVCRIICGKIISCAISLAPDRNIFKKNLKSLELDNIYRSKEYNFPFTNVREGCKQLGAGISFLQVNRTIKLSLPQVINKDIEISSKHICEAKLPDTYLAEFDNAKIFSDTDLIIVNDIVLYDEIDKGEIGIYAIKSPLVKEIQYDKITIKTPVTLGKMIECGIHFSKDHSKNYFHWLVECLPRLSLVNQLDKNIPLLVSRDLPYQSFEALNLINIDNRPIIKLSRSEFYQVKKLYYPSQLSLLHDNYNTPNYHKDIVYCPEAINFIRNLVLEKSKIILQQGHRKIYISRKNSNYRQLLNTVEIENLLVARGFEIVFPEYLSFSAQVQIFSQAKIIIGQSGAGMVNFIFAPKDCKVLMIAGYDPRTNFHGFYSLASLIGVDLKFLLGKNIHIPTTYELHADFYIDIPLLLNYLEANNE